MSERITCEFCGSKILKKDLTRHHKTKKCMKARYELTGQRYVSDDKPTVIEQHAKKNVKEENDKETTCEYCSTVVLKRMLNRHHKTKKCMKIQEALSSKNSLCDKERILDLERRLLQKHKDMLALKEEKNKLKEEKDNQILVLKEEKDNQILVLKEEKDNQILALKEEKDKLQNIINKKDEFIENMASRPIISNNTTNTFSINQYFEGNRGLEYLNDKNMLEERKQYCKSLMNDTLEQYGFNIAKIAETKQNQCETLFKDEVSGKWNVVNTDATRNSFTVCKRDEEGNSLVLKDPKGKLLKGIVRDIDTHNSCTIAQNHVHNNQLPMSTRDERLAVFYPYMTNDVLINRIPVKSTVA